jgi:o-succinylbenzoate synthase
MKIEKIHIHHLRMNLRSHFETSFGRINSRDCILLEVFSEGLVGYGECVADHDPGYSYETSSTSWDIYKEFILPAVLQAQPSNPQEYRKTVEKIRGHPMAKAGLEMALWDLVGKRQTKSLAELLGADKERVEVGVSIGIQDTPEELVSVIDQYLDKGYSRIKIKIKPGRDVSDARAVRKAFPEIRLQVDANSAYTLENVTQLTPLDEMNLLLIEQPLAEDDLWDHSRLQPLFRTPLCLDESILSARHARQAIEMGSCRIINIKAGRVGGLSEAVAVHQHCFEKSIPVWCGGMLETGVGRASNLALAALPGFVLPADISASERYYVEDITQEAFTLNPDSTINVPNGIGLGIHIDEMALKRATIQTLKLKA